MTSENRTQQSTRVGPEWLTVQTASLAAMAIIVLSGAAGFALIGELHLAAVLGMIAVLPLVLMVIFARAGQGAAWSASPNGRDIYERQAWTKPIFGAYRSLSDIRRVTLASAITALLTLPTRSSRTCRRPPSASPESSDSACKCRVWDSALPPSRSCPLRTISRSSSCAILSR